MQWLTPPSAMMQQLLPDNADATFGSRIRACLPSDLLLHYNYGAAAVKLWGHGADMIEDLAKRPPKPDPIPSGPSKEVHNRKSGRPRSVSVRKPRLLLRRPRNGKPLQVKDRSATQYGTKMISCSFFGEIQGSQQTVTLKSVKQKRRVSNSL